MCIYVFFISKWLLHALGHQERPPRKHCASSIDRSIDLTIYVHTHTRLHVCADSCSIHCQQMVSHALEAREVPCPHILPPPAPSISVHGMYGTMHDSAGFLGGGASGGHGIVQGSAGGGGGGNGNASFPFTMPAYGMSRANHLPAGGNDVGGGRSHDGGGFYLSQHCQGRLRHHHLGGAHTSTGYVSMQVRSACTAKNS